MNLPAPAGHAAGQPTVRIDITRGWSDCEDCGSYDWANAKLTLPARVLDAGYDGHFGGGNWSGSEAVLYLWALRVLGVDIHVDGQPLPEHPYYRRNPGEDWSEEVLCAVPARVVNIEVVRRPDPDFPEETDPAYMYPVSASWLAADGRTQRVSVDAGWDGEVGSLYRRVLEEHARVKVKKSERH